MSAGEPRKWIGRIVRWLFGIAGAVFVVLAFRDSWNRSRDVVLPPVWRIVLAAALLVAALVFSAIGWSRLFGSRNRALMRAFLLSQPAKYVPGGPWQILGVVGLTQQAGIGIERAVAAFPVWIFIQIAASGVVGSTLAVFGAHVRPLIRGLALLGVLPLGLLHRSWLVALSNAYARLRKTSRRPDLVPEQPAIVAALGWTLLTVVANGLAFGLLLRGLHGASLAVSVPLFALSWIAGFLAIPVPAGLGIREGTMLAIVGAGGGATIAASILQRLLAVVAEGSLAGLFLRRDRPPEP